MVAAGLLALASAHGCPPLWTKLGANCYRYFGFPRPMRIAERVCAQFTSCSDAGTTAVAHLSSIVDSRENTFLFNLVESLAMELPPAPVWMGLNDIAAEGRWTWPDGQQYVYKNWERGHPNNNQNADCMAMPGERPGAGWISVNCMEEFSYICKMPAANEPEVGAGAAGPGMQPYLSYPDYIYYY